MIINLPHDICKDLQNIENAIAEWQLSQLLLLRAPEIALEEIMCKIKSYDCQEQQ